MSIIEKPIPDSPFEGLLEEIVALPETQDYQEPVEEPFDVKAVPVAPKKSQLLCDLEALRELLTPQERWTTGKFVRHLASGEKAYCLVGGAHAVTGTAPTFDADMYGVPIWERKQRKAMRRNIALRRALQQGRGNSDNALWSLNDFRGHAAVIGLIDQAIETERGAI